jgi:beta-N-acetylhexosaminidase
MFRPNPAADVQRAHRHLQERSKIPLLLAANLERGGNGLITEGTQFGCQLQVAATDDEEMAYRLGLVSGREAAAVGCNWSFSPVVDIDFNPANPITNTRTFGSDPDRVRRLGVAFARGLRDAGLAAAAKHWPGDGVDGRDQHLLTSVNTLEVDEWERTFGSVYRALIEDGVESVMSAHIMLPAYSRVLVPGIADEAIMPASLAPELNLGLLRQQLGFNGLIVTDATPMAGFTLPLARRRAVPGAIAAGSDMFLFTLNLGEDVALMRAGLEEGLLSESRLDDAVTRILALKASLGLHRAQAAGSLVPDGSALERIGTEEHRAWARECADRAVTLVKDRDLLLPLRPEKHRRLLVHTLGDIGGYRDADTAGAANQFIELLRAHGFEATAYERPAKAGLEISLSDLTDRFDAIVYFANVSTQSNQTIVRITWDAPMGVNAPRFVQEIPTIFVSVANPYHLQDVPRVSTHINAYTGTQVSVEAVVAKLVGDSPFMGISPVDPTCGLWDATL